MRQFRTSGSVEGVTGNRHLYSDQVGIGSHPGPSVRHVALDRRLAGSAASAWWSGASFASPSLRWC
jgi:hypothetical protein